MALSSKGISAAFIGTTKRLAINTNIYINKCLSKLRLLIEEHHAGDKYIVWPDLMSSHYANEATHWLLQQKVKYVLKQVNPTNVPIKDFCSILAEKVDGMRGKQKRNYN